ncbi:hypothetical protein HZC35_00350 [Candidatus Saganbacteria bacterium]|nr:hypothetical protein [Candidatus Saganbacteria bacterium]
MGPGHPVGGPRQSGGPTAGGAPISHERLRLRIDKAYALYKAGEGFFALSELEDLQREVGMSALHPVGLKPSKLTAVSTALHSTEVLLVVARELKGRGFNDLAHTCLLSGSAEFASDLISKKKDLDPVNLYAAIDQLLGCMDDLQSLGKMDSADKVLAFLKLNPGLSGKQPSRLASLLMRADRLEEAIGLLAGPRRPRDASFYYDLVTNWPDFVEQHQAALLPGMKVALRVGIESFRSKDINLAGLIDCELSILTTLLEHSPRTALTAYRGILLPLVHRHDKVIDPTGSLRPIAEAIQEVAQRQDIVALLPAYFDAIAAFVMQVLGAKGVNPLEGLWHEIPIILRKVPGANFTSAMDAFTELYIAYVETANDELTPKAMRQILPLLPADKFESALRDMAALVRAGIDPATRLDELVR